jgi:hypothetical protein
MASRSSVRHQDTEFGSEGAVGCADTQGAGSRIHVKERTFAAPHHATLYLQRAAGALTAKGDPCFGASAIWLDAWVRWPVPDLTAAIASNVALSTRNELTYPPTFRSPLLSPGATRGGGSPQGVSKDGPRPLADLHHQHGPSCPRLLGHHHLRVVWLGGWAARRRPGWLLLPAAARMADIASSARSKS